MKKSVQDDARYRPPLLRAGDGPTPAELRTTRDEAVLDALDAASKRDLESIAWALGDYSKSLPGRRQRGLGTIVVNWTLADLKSTVARLLRRGLVRRRGKACYSMTRAGETALAEARAGVKREETCLACAVQGRKPVKLTVRLNVRQAKALFTLFWWHGDRGLAKVPEGTWVSVDEDKIIGDLLVRQARRLAPRRRRARSRPTRPARRKAAVRP